MGYTKDQLLDRLRELQIDFVCHDHPPVLTVEAQAEHVGHLGGGLSKNLLLKDKKHRFYVVSALADTNVDLKVLSQRLGLGKGGLRMAPEEALQELLQVPPGCVTPFAFINDSARTVSLLLDQGFKANECCFFHPLSNDMTISISPSNLEKFLTSIGRKPSYVDLEANPKVGKDNPPDLADLVLSEVSSLSDQMEKVDSVQKYVPSEKSADLTGTSNQMEKPLEKKSTNHTANTRPNNSKATLEKSQSTSDPPINAANVSKFVEEVIDMTAAVVLSEIKKAGVPEKDTHDSSAVDAVRKHITSDLENLTIKEAGDPKKDAHDSSVVDAVRKHITSDLENLTVILKNEAYSQGFHAGFRSALPQKYW